MTKALTFSIVSPIRLFVIGALLMCSVVALPAPAHAASLTEAQITAIVSLLSSFGVDPATIANVGNILHGTNTVIPAQSTSVQSTSANTAASSLNVSVDASSPAYQVVAGGSNGVTVGVIKLRATGGEAINVGKIGLRLTSGKPADLGQVYFYSRFGDLLGSTVFTGLNTFATSTLTTGINIPRDTDSTVIVKADLASICVSCSGTEGDLVQIDPANAEGYGVNSGTTVKTGATGAVGGVRVYKSYPTLGQVTLPNTVLVNGINSLLRFKITASPSGDIGIGKLSFKLANNTSLYNLSLYAFTDSSYMNPAPGLGAAGQVGSTIASPSNPLVYTTVSPGEIPAGQTYYFELRGTLVTTPTSQPVITATLLRDEQYAPIQQGSVLMQNNNFVWSPNTRTWSAYTDTDWANGYQLPGFSVDNISQTTSGSGSVTPAPTCTLSTDKTSYTLGDTIKLSWSSTNATYGNFVPDTSGKDNFVLGGDKLATSGSINLAANVLGNPFVTLAVYGAGGSATCKKIIPVVEAPVPPTPVASPTCSISAAAAQIANGKTTTITWTVGNATKATLFPAAGMSINALNQSSLGVNSAGTYTLTATNSVGVTATCTTNVTVVSVAPTAPTNLQASCSADNKQVTVSWSAPTTTLYYLLRINNAQNDATTCQDGWYCANTEDVRTDNGLYATSYTTAVTPGQTYQWWLLARNAVGPSPTAVGTDIKCGTTVSEDTTQKSFLAAVIEAPFYILGGFFHDIFVAIGGN